MGEDKTELDVAPKVEVIRRNKTVIYEKLTQHS